MDICNAAKIVKKFKINIDVLGRYSGYSRHHMSRLMRGEGSASPRVKRAMEYGLTKMARELTEDVVEFSTDEWDGRPI